MEDKVAEDLLQEILKQQNGNLPEEEEEPTNYPKDLEKIALLIASLLESDPLINYCLVGGFAVSLHGYRRYTADLDYLVSEKDIVKFVNCLHSSGQFVLVKGLGESFRMQNMDTHVFVDILRSPEFGRDPSGNIVVGSPWHLASLETVIEMKLISYIARDSYKDLSDIQNLVKIHKLSVDFSKQLPKRLRSIFKQLFFGGGIERRKFLSIGTRTKAKKCTY